MALQISLSPSHLRSSISVNCPCSSSSSSAFCGGGALSRRRAKGIAGVAAGEWKGDPAGTIRTGVESVGVYVGIVTEVNKDTFWPIVKAAGPKVVVLDMYTKWCGPCKIIAPRFEELSQKNQDVVFLKLDCNDNNRPLAKELGIKVVPTFKIFKDGKVVKEVTGAKFDDLVLAIENAKST